MAASSIVSWRLVLRIVFARKIDSKFDHDQTCWPSSTSPPRLKRTGAVVMVSHLPWSTDRRRDGRLVRPSGMARTLLGNDAHIRASTSLGRLSWRPPFFETRGSLLGRLLDRTGELRLARLRKALSGAVHLIEPELRDATSAWR